MTTMHADLPASKHFRMEALADGIYVAIAAEGGGAVCNAGIVDLGEQTLVFDTFQTPQAARDLRAAAEQLFSSLAYLTKIYQGIIHWF